MSNIWDHFRNSKILIFALHNLLCGHKMSWAQNVQAQNVQAWAQNVQAWAQNWRHIFCAFYWAQNLPRHRISQAQDVSLGTRLLKKLDFWAQNRKPGHKMSWAQNLPGTKSKMGTKSTRHIISWAQNLQAQNRGTKYLGTESPGTKSVSPVNNNYGKVLHFHIHLGQIGHLTQTRIW